MKVKLNSDKKHYVEIHFGTEEYLHKIYFKADNSSQLVASSEAFLASALLSCMKSSQEFIDVVGVGPEVSCQFYEAFSEIQSIFQCWDKGLTKVAISGLTPARRPGNGSKRVGVFFTGGVDSFYTLLKHKESITDLIFVHGLDIELKDKVLRKKTSESLQYVAGSLGKNLIEIETNIRLFTNHYRVDWGSLAHGSVLATVGHLLNPAFSRIYIPSSFTYSNLFPWGSHPVLDRLWSSEVLEFVHDGCEATRVEKVRRIANNRVVLRTLRVCYQNSDSVYNCGRCEKCIRTMINLKVNGALENCTTFEGGLNDRDIKKLPSFTQASRAFLEENLEALKSNESDPELAQLLSKMLKANAISKRIVRKARVKVRSFIRAPPVTQPTF